jgi:hypothetical protein
MRIAEFEQTSAPMQRACEHENECLSRAPVFVSDYAETSREGEHEDDGWAAVGATVRRLFGVRRSALGVRRCAVHLRHWTLGLRSPRPS